MQAPEQQLEEVYRVAPMPEEYMKYQLHLNTGMEMEQIDQWFKDRRACQSAVPEIKSGATVTTGMKGGAAWENDSRGREPAVSSVSTGQPGLNIPAPAATPQHKSPDQAGQPADRLRGGSVAANEPIHSGRPGLMGPPQRPEVSAAGRPVQPGSSTDVRARNASSQALDAHLTMHQLDWLGEPGEQPRPGNNTDGDGALRQASGALIETMGHPNNASFLLSFMDGGGAAKEGDGRKEQLAGSFRQPAPNGRSLAEMPPAGYPTAAGGGPRSSGSGRSPGSMAPPPAQVVGGQQRSWPEGGAAPQLPRGGHPGAAAAILDQFDAQCTGDKQMREWFSGGGGQSGLPMGSSSSGTSRSWRLQQWDIQGGPTASQAPYPQSDMLMYPMSMAGRSPQDAAQQLEELEKGQELQRGTASLPALPGHHYRQELLGGFPSRSHDGRRSTADLSSWRRPTLYSGSGPQQAFMPDIPAPTAAAAHTPVGLAAHMSDPTPLANQALAALVDGVGGQRRSAPLPRSISDVSDSQRFSGSGGFPCDSSRSASDTVQHGSGDLLLPDDPAATSEVRFVEQDLDCVAGLIGLQTIASVEEHEGSRQLFLFEQLTHLDSLAMESNAAPNPGKRRRVRHQHFWRNSDKLPPEHRLYVTSADIKLALEQAEPVKPRRQITSAERTNMWTVCLTSQGVLGYLNRRVSPLGVRLFRASQAQLRAGSGNALGQKAPSLPALLLPKPKPAAGPPGSGSGELRPVEEPASAKKRRTSLRRSQS
ncbi:g1485 [Coccomyxa elongata]